MSLVNFSEKKSVFEHRREENSSEKLNFHIVVEKRIKVTASATDSVKDLKAQIEAMEGISRDNQQLFCNMTKPLENYAMKLESLHLRSGDHLYAVEKTPREWIQVFIKHGIERVPVSVGQQWTVKKLKMMAEEMLNLHYNPIQLVHQGKVLSDSTILDSLDLKDCTTIHVFDARTRKINVRSPMTNASHSVEIAAVDTVGILKEKIATFFVILPAHQTLMFKDTLLDDGREIQTYGMEDCSLVWIFPKCAASGGQ